MDIPRIGFGTARLVDPVVLDKVLTYAIEESGIRAIDTADVYNNEEAIGKVLKKIFENGKVKRTDLFITTKLASTNHRPELVEPALLNSLKKLQLDYIDLYLIHMPLSLVPQPDGNLNPRTPDGKALVEHIDIIDTWLAMEKLQQKKLATRIGVSNFSIEMLERMKLSPRVTVQPYINQIEQHLYNQRWAQIDYLEKNGIRLTSWSSFASGANGPNGVSLLNDPVVLEVAKEVGKPPSQVSLQFLLQLSPIINIIPRSSNIENVKLNSRIDFILSEDQMEKLKKLNCGYRIFNAVELWGYDVYGIGI